MKLKRCLPAGRRRSGRRCLLAAPMLENWSRVAVTPGTPASRRLEKRALDYSLGLRPRTPGSLRLATLPTVARQVIVATFKDPRLTPALILRGTCSS